MEDYDGSHTFEHSAGGYPPKPILIEERKNSVMRSITSLFIYALLFYFLFERNIAYIAAILVVIIIHEAGHFLFMKIFNYSNVKIFIIPLIGALTSGRKQVVSQFQWCLIILGGPVPGIIIGTALYFLNADIGNDTLKMLANSFLIINLLNCLPFYPLDGGRLIEVLFFRNNFTIRLVFGVISILALGALFIYSKSLILLVVPILIAMELNNERKHQKIRDYLKNEKIDYQVDYKNLPDKDYWLIRDCLIFSFPKKYAGVQPGVYEVGIAEPLLIQHINSILQIKVNYDLNLISRILILLFYIAITIGPVLLINFRL